MRKIVNSVIWIRVLKIVLFFFILISLGVKIFEVFNYKSTGGGGGWQRFYDEKRDSIDVIAFGSSHAHCTIDHGYLWDNYGIAGFTLSAGAQAIDSTYYYVQEALAYQNPKVLLVEVWGVVGDEPISNSEDNVYRSALGMRWSTRYLEYVKYLTTQMKKDREWRNGLFTKIPIVHSRYIELSEEDFHDQIPFMKGYRGSDDIEPFEKPSCVDYYETAEIEEGKRQMLQNIIDLAAEKKVKLIFFAAPYNLDDAQQAKFNMVAKIAESNGVEFINYNHIPDKIGLDYERDFRDPAHLNDSGAEKVTDYLAQVLINNYGVIDRRGQAKYNLWEDNALYLHNRKLSHKLVRTSDLHNYLDLVNQAKDNQTVILTLAGNYMAQGDIYLEDLLKMGISKEDYLAGGAWVFKEGKLLSYFPGKEYKTCIKKGHGEIHLQSFCEQTENDEIVEQSKIIIDNQACKMVDNGINIVIYNEQLSQIIDIAGVDIYLGTDVEHKEELHY